MSNTHEPLEVTSVDGMPMVKCSCDGDNPQHIRWQSAYWLRDHWEGDADSGVTALRAVVARQAPLVNAPTTEPEEGNDD